MKNTIRNTQYAILITLILAWLVLPQTSQAAAPVADDQALTINEDTSINITLTASDADEDSLTYSIVTAPSHGSFTTNIPPKLTYRPYSNYNGADSFTFKANDGTSDSNIATISLTINPLNDAPIVSSIPAPITFAINPEETSVTKTYIIPVTDIENDPLTYSVVGLPLGASFNTQTGEITWTFTHQDIASYPNITFTASDGQLQSSKTVTIVLREARTYYLDEVNGDDSNGGTNETPWKTLAKARATLVAGDTVKLRNGNYGEFKIVSPFTSPTDWITYEADTGHTPVFTKVYIYFGSTKDVYHNFNNIIIQEVDPGLDPNDPPSWTSTFACRITYANYVHFHNCTISGFNKYTTATVVMFDGAENCVLEHCDIKKGENGVYVTGTDNQILYNHIHEISGGSMVRLTGGTGHLFEGNHCHDMNKNKYDDFYPPEAVWVDPAEYPQGSPPALIPGEEIRITGPFKEDPNYTASGTVLSVKWHASDGCYNVYFRAISGYFNYLPDGSNVVGQQSGVVFKKYDHEEGIHTGSVISVRAPQQVIRNNIIHDITGNGLKWYPGYSFYDMVIENNLIYDITNGGTAFPDMTGKCVFRNNTFIGSVNSDVIYERDLDNRYMYGGSAIGSYKTGDSYDGSGTVSYNNVIVGAQGLPYLSDPNLSKYGEDYNIFWSRSDESNETKGTHSLVCYWRSPGYHPRGWPNYFENIGYVTGAPYNGKTGINVTRGSQSPPYDYDYSVDGITPFFVNPGFRFIFTGFNQDRHKIFDFCLAAGSPGINFGATTVKTYQEVLAGYTGPSQPPDSLGSIGPDGFIKDDGPARDAEHHSAGCYEYISTSILYGDVNADGEVSAYDAALAAHIAVELEHPDIKNRAAADVNGDGEVSAYDAALIAQRAVGLIEKFPVKK